MSYKSFSSCRYATLRRVVVAVTNGAFPSTSSYDVSVALELKVLHLTVMLCAVT